MLHLIHAALHPLPLFAHLDLARHATLIEKIEVMYYPAGYAIFRAGDPGDTMYVVKTGEVEILVTRDGAEHVLATITSGGFFGEMALIDEAPRNASARTKTETEVFRLDRETLRTLLADVPEADIRLTEEYLRRRGKYH